MIHARHARQGSDDPATWSAIARAKAQAKIPLIGNGDIASLADFGRLETETAADGAMIARGAIRSPWVFRGLTQKGSPEPTSLEELDAAEASYNRLADRFHARPKFRTWHAQGFARMRARLLGKTVQGSAMPENQNLF